MSCFTVSFIKVLCSETIKQRSLTWSKQQQTIFSALVAMIRDDVETDFIANKFDEKSYSQSLTNAEATAHVTSNGRYLSIFVFHIAFDDSDPTAEDSLVTLHDRFHLESTDMIYGLGRLFRLRRVFGSPWTRSTPQSVNLTDHQIATRSFAANSALPDRFVEATVALYCSHPVDLPGAEALEASGEPPAFEQSSGIVNTDLDASNDTIGRSVISPIGPDWLMYGEIPATTKTIEFFMKPVKLVRVTASNKWNHKDRQRSLH